MHHMSPMHNVANSKCSIITVIDHIELKFSEALVRDFFFLIYLFDIYLKSFKTKAN